MFDVGADLSGLLGPLVVGLILVAGARTAVRSASPPPRHGRHRIPGRLGALRRLRPAQRRRVARPAVPAPLSGAAAGLLESIPHLEPVRSSGRLRGTARLGATMALVAALLAALLLLAGRTFVNWFTSLGPA